MVAAGALDAADAHDAPGHRGFWAWRLVAAADAHDAPAAAMMLQATRASGLWRVVAAAGALDAAGAHDAPGHRGFWAVEACGSG